MKSRIIDFFPAIAEIINKCDVCYLGMVDQDNKPYVIPMNFGFEGKTICLHSAMTGKKINVLKNNNNVCLAFSTDHVLRYRDEEVACSWSMKYRSVLAYGKVKFEEDYDEKVRMLNLIMKKYAGKEYTYNAPAVNGVQVYKVVVERFEGRAYGY